MQIRTEMSVSRRFECLELTIKLCFWWLDWNEFMNYMLIENTTLSHMKKEHFEYVKSEYDDPSPSFID